MHDGMTEKILPFYALVGVYNEHSFDHVLG
jgi:hypothetical protein